MVAVESLPAERPRPAPAPAAHGIAAMSERSKMILFLFMALGQFMALLDIQIVAASLSEIQAGLSASADEISWIQTSYLVAEIVMIPLSGYLSRALSTRWLFTGSAVAFTLASVACGLAWNIESMILFRAIQGFVGGAMVPTVFATGFALFQGRKQALIPAILGIVSTLAPTIGPTLGGWITETASWHWLFFLNIVPGIVISIAIPILARVDEPDLDLLRVVDLIGVALLAVFLGAFEYVVEEGPRWDWFDDDLIRGLAYVSALGGIAFIWRTLTHARPIVDLRALGDRVFAIACVFNFVTGFGIFGTVYILPLFLARVQDFNALQIGSAVFVTGIAMILATPIVAALSKRVDSRILMSFGLTVFAIGVYDMGDVTADWVGHEFFWPQAIRGFAIMFCIVPATNMALSSLPPPKLKMASALFSTMRNLGGAVGIAAINTVLNDQTKLHYARLSESITAARAVVDARLETVASHLAGVTSDVALSQQMAYARLVALARREATTMAFADAFLMIAALFAGALLLVPLIGRLKQAPAPSADVH